LEKRERFREYKESSSGVQRKNKYRSKKIREVRYGGKKERGAIREIYNTC